MLELPRKPREALLTQTVTRKSELRGLKTKVYGTISREDFYVKRKSCLIRRTLRDYTPISILEQSTIDG